jgi:hypothetical protein
MSDETNVPQDVAQAEPVSNEAVVPAIEEQDLPASTEETSEEKSDPVEEAKSEPEKVKKTPWYQSRLNEMATQKNEAIARAAAYEAQLANLASGKPAVATPEVIRAEAAKLVSEEKYNAKCNEVFQAGTAKHADYGVALGNFQQIGGAPREMLEIVTDLPNGADILYHLANNLDDAYELTRLPPHKMALEMGRLSEKLGKAPAPKPVSNAPAPLKTVNGRGTVDAEPPETDVDAWRAWDRKQRAKRNSA